jgi:hypothetical protein
VKIRNFVHKGLKRLYAEDSAKGLGDQALHELGPFFLVGLGALA